jgi:hypothetical protein
MCNLVSKIRKKLLMNPLTARSETPRLGVRRTLVSIAIAFAWSALAQSVPAVTPAPDGGYPSGNTAEGDNALFRLGFGQNNTAIGFEALFNIVNGVNNTAIGFHALYSNEGSDNIATGSLALLSNTSGSENTATGYSALINNTTGGGNTATGSGALGGNQVGNFNTATGESALSWNTTGSSNTAIGAAALGLNTTGTRNTASGFQALAGVFSPVTPVTGSDNTADGYRALRSVTNGRANTATGSSALLNNTTGFQNTASGVSALLANTTGNGNTAFGSSTLQRNTGSYNTAVGFNAGAALTTGHDNVDIQTVGVAGESNTMRIGSVKQTSTFISGIRGVTTTNANAVPVVVDSAGQLGTVSSSRRFKDDVKPMDNASDAILALKPVSFHYKSDTKNTPQFGLIAEEVAKVNPDLVVRDDKGEIYTVRYEAVNAMLLNEFLKEHRKVEDQAGEIAQMKKQIEALTATVRKVSDQVALGKPAPQLVANP